MTEEEKFEYKHGFRLGPYLFGWAVIYFIVFGFLSNYWQKTPGDNVLFIYKNLWVIPFKELNFSTGDIEWNWGSWYIILILFGVAIFVGFQEDFLINAIKRCFWLIPHVLILSIVWDGINDVFLYRNFIKTTTFVFTIIMSLAEYFTSVHGYLNLLALLVIFVGGGMLGGWIKIFRRERMYKKAQLLIEKEVEESS